MAEEVSEIDVLRMLAEGWRGGLGGSLWVHFTRGNQARSFGNGVIYSLLHDELITCDDDLCFSLSLTEKGSDFYAHHKLKAQPLRQGSE